MYPTSEAYKNKIKELGRTFSVSIEIQHSAGVLALTDADIIQGSLIYTESAQAGEEFLFGGVVASHIDFEIVRKPEYQTIDFVGATVIPQIGLLIQSTGDSENYFLEHTFPAEIADGPQVDQYEYVPLGVFHIDEAVRRKNTVQIKAIDNMIEFDRPYSQSSLVYPATLKQIYIDACNHCAVPIGTVSFLHDDYLVETKPSGDITFRDVMGWIAELSGNFVKTSRTGAVELKWYEASGLSLDGSNRFDFNPREDVVSITGIAFTVEDVTYVAGTEEGAIDLSDNQLFQGGYETILPAIYNAVKDTVFNPYESNWQGNPAVQAGDIVTQVARDGTVYETLVTTSVYKYRGRSLLAARGKPEKAKGYQGSTNKKISEIKRKIVEEMGGRLTAVEEAQLNATEMIANMLGGHLVVEEGALYIADNPDIDLATKVWKWGIGGFGYSSTGKDGPYTTAITADGSIVAMLVSANIITADMIIAGKLQSADNSTWIDLDDGAFQFENADSGLRIASVDGIKVSHTDGSYTRMANDGFVRKVTETVYQKTPSGTPSQETFTGKTRGDLEADGWVFANLYGAAVPSGVSITVDGLVMTNGITARVYRETTQDDAVFEITYRMTTTDREEYYIIIDGTTHTLPFSTTLTTHTITVPKKGMHCFMFDNFRVEYGNMAVGSGVTIYIKKVVFEQTPAIYSPIGTEVGEVEYNYMTYVGAGTTGHTQRFDPESVPDVYIQLPDQFKGKNFEVFAFLQDTGAPQGNGTISSIDISVMQIDHANASFVVRARMNMRYPFMLFDSMNFFDYYTGCDFAYVVTH